MNRQVPPPFDYKFPLETPQFRDSLDKFYETSVYDEIFGDLQEVTPQPQQPQQQQPSPGTIGSHKQHSLDDFQDLDVDLLGLGGYRGSVHSQHHSHNSLGMDAASHMNPGFSAHMVSPPGGLNGSNTNIMYPATLPSPQLGTPMSQMSLTSQSISSSESLHHTPPLSVQMPTQQTHQHQQQQQQHQQHQPQHQQQPPNQHPQHPQQTQIQPQTQPRRPPPQGVPWNMVPAPTPWGAWGLGGSAAAAAAAAALSQHNGVRVSHIPVSNNPAPRKKLTENQLRVLEKVFSETPKPCIKTRTDLERDLDLPKKNIQIWFQNRRAKEKQNQKKSKEAADVTTAPGSNPTAPPGVSSAARPPHMATAAAAAAINSDGPQGPQIKGRVPPGETIMHITNANGKQVPTTRQRPGLSLQRSLSTASNGKAFVGAPPGPTTPTMAAPTQPITPGSIGGSKHPSSTSLPALASSANSDTPKRHRSNSSASFDRRFSSTQQNNLVGMGISMPSGHSRSSSTSVLGPPLERKTPADALVAATKMRRSNSLLGMSRRGSETASAPVTGGGHGHARKNSMPMNHVTGQVGSMTSLTSMTPSLSHTPSASGQVTPNLMTPHTPQFSLDDGEVTPLNSPSAYAHMTPGPATPMSAQFRDRSFSQSSLYGPIAEDLESMHFGNPVEFEMGGGSNQNMPLGSRDSSVYTTNTVFSQSRGSFTSLSTSVDSMSATSMPDPSQQFSVGPDESVIPETDSKRVSVVKEEDDPYFQFVLSSMFPNEPTQDQDEFYNTMMGIS